MGDNVNTPEETASASSNMDRRRMLQVGTAGVVAVGAVAAGAPQVLGLSSSPLYAAAASGPGETTTTVRQNQSTITGQVNLLQADSTQFLLPATYTNIIGHLYSAATGGSVLASAAAFAQEGENFIAYTFYGLGAGTYYLDYDDALTGLTGESTMTLQTFSPNPSGRIKFVLTTTSTNPGQTISTTLSA